MLKHTTNSKERGFTLVELLIVIVVIAILAAISIVAYNGIQQRTRNTAAQASAQQLSTKVEIWNTEESTYPDWTTVEAGMTAHEQTRMEQDLRNKLTNGAPDRGTPVQYEQCGSGAGARITYFVEANPNTTEVLTRGTC